MTIKVLSNQSLLDLAVQYCGAAEAALESAFANGRSITDDLEAGAELTTTDIFDLSVFNYFQNNNLKPATGFNAEASGGQGAGQDGDEEGIEFWYVEYDLTVSR